MLPMQTQTFKVHGVCAVRASGWGDAGCRLGQPHLEALRDEHSHKLKERGENQAGKE